MSNEQQAPLSTTEQTQEITHGHDHSKRRHADLLKGLGNRPAPLPDLVKMTAKLRLAPASKGWNSTDRSFSAALVPFSRLLSRWSSRTPDAWVLTDTIVVESLHRLKSC